jgi:hypothetical protein
MRWAIATRISLAVALAATALAWSGVPAEAQSANSASSTPSVADAAKQSTEKKKAAASAAKVITDDDLNPSNVKPGQEGLTTPTPPQSDAVPPSSAEVAQVEAADAKAAKSPADDPAKKSDSPKIKALKERLAQAEQALQLSQRESALEQDTVYSKPDYQHDTAGKAKLDALQQEISEHSQRVEELKAQLADLEKTLEKEGPGQPATQPQSDQPAAPPQQ